MENAKDYEILCSTMQQLELLYSDLPLHERLAAILVSGEKMLYGIMKTFLDHTHDDKTQYTQRVLSAHLNGLYENFNNELLNAMAVFLQNNNKPKQNLTARQIVYANKILQEAMDAYNSNI